ncbi:MAG: hypothetical protein LPK58_01110 [Gammaproteobacteria bacterium]|nr:hypothetical protein [Gammaproteobacteria bacterium]MDX5374340.1 hypothetical protein [Gammaproteobacteria bacterium]
MLDGPSFPPSLHTTPAKRYAGPRVGGGGVAAPVASARPVEDTEQNAAARQGEARDNSREQQQLQYLRARDQEVRNHERAHLAAAGPHARGGARYDYQRGPDGRMYAVGGEVSIDTAPVPGDPRASLEKAETVQRAALAPAQPSAQDLSVAAQARQMAAQARVEIARQQAEERADGDMTGATPSRGDLAQRIGAMGGGLSSLAARPDPLLDAVV